MKRIDINISNSAPGKNANQVEKKTSKVSHIYLNYEKTGTFQNEYTSNSLSIYAVQGLMAKKLMLTLTQ